LGYGNIIPQKNDTEVQPFEHMNVVSEANEVLAPQMNMGLQRNMDVHAYSEGRPQDRRSEGVQRNMVSQKTKKNKRTMTLTEKNKLWDLFDTEKNVIDHVVDIQEISNQTSGFVPKTDIECIVQGMNTTSIIVDLEELPLKYGAIPTKKSEDSFHRCYTCNHILMIMEDGFPTCTNTDCGIMYKDILDYSPEWRFYGANDKNATDPTRCGNPINPLLVESSFGCKILCDNRSSYEMKKIRKWTEWQSTPHREKSLYEEFQFITIMAQNAGIPKIFIDYAMVIHKDISEQKMFRGMNRDGIKAASIYISCRLNECPRTAHEIADIFKLDKQSTTYGCSMAVNILNNIERNIDPAQKTELGTTTPSAFIDRYCSRLNIANELAIFAKFIAKKIENNSIVCDNTPQSSAAGIVYFVAQICKLDISKVDIKTICGVSEVTINKCYRKLDTIRHQLVPQCIFDKYA
jgi:transcription initiation factor TFIIB